MATTTDGRALTEAHRRQQVQVAADVALEVDHLVTTFAVVATETAYEAWLSTTLFMLRSRWGQSQQLARNYLWQYDLAEGGPAFSRVIELPFNDVTARTRLTEAVPKVNWLAGDVLKISASAQEVAPQRALAGGRSLLDRTSRARRVRYRRVSDGNPCAFCAMLASRGPSYSEESAYFRAHPHCGCTAEPVYGTWTPSAVEQEWVAAYEEAAKQAREAGEPAVAPKGRSRRDTILWRMRRNRPDLFSDGIQRRSA